VRRLWVLKVVVAWMLVFAVPTAWAQPTYPTKPVEIIVPWGPGGATDLCTRVIAKYATQEFGIPVNVVNKPGGGGLIAINEVLTSAKPDGYTLLAETHGGSSMLGRSMNRRMCPSTGAGELGSQWWIRTWSYTLLMPTRHGRR
jgi:tripartite-type tricarboxylate transporter receptor subunit TctC